MSCQCKAYIFIIFSGAIDGKHISVQCPQLSGSKFHNYKGGFSTILLAVADADYCFVYVDVGTHGSAHDGTVFSQSTLGQRLQEGGLDLPPPPGDGLEYVFVADEAFPLRDEIMRPYPGRGMEAENRHKRLVFNYRLSRARRIVENAFGILVAKWRIFRQPIIASTETVNNVVKAACVLHNFLRRRDGMSSDALPYINSDDLDIERNGEITRGLWRQQTAGALRDTGRLGSNNANRQAIDLRERFAQHFLSPEGAVPWQDSVVRRGLLSGHVRE